MLIIQNVLKLFHMCRELLSMGASTTSPKLYTESYSPLAYRLSTRQMALTLTTFPHRALALLFITIRYVRMAWAGLKADKPKVHGIADFITYIL